jgi:16S rRNA (cytidine1402-2'-O)-methyltransferase
MARLILLSTPIGNMADLTYRVKQALEEGVHFAVEDSRSFREFLARAQVSSEGKHILSFHDQSSQAKWERLIDIIHQGHDLYVCSEAGSPVLSDPAYPLVKLAYERGFDVQSYSGISSVTVALELSGLPPLPFSFHGFLSREAGKIRSYLQTLASGTHIFFEAGNRLLDTLLIAGELWPEAEFVILKEMTKTHQRRWAARGAELTELLASVDARGEFVWLVHLPQDPRPLVPERIRQAALEVLQEGGGKKDLSKLLGEILQRPSKEIYAELNKGVR